MKKQPALHLRCKGIITSLILSFISSFAFANPPSSTVVTTTGTYDFVVPSSGSYTFTLKGADGGDSWANGQLGGSGATMTATFFLMAGDNVRVFVGQSGMDGQRDARTGGGGGGGTAIVVNGTNLLIVAAGGGGGSRGLTGGGALANTSPTAAGGGSGSFWGAGGGGFGYAGANPTSMACTSGVTGGAAGNLTTISAGGAGREQSYCTPVNGGQGFGGGGGSNSQSGGGGGGYVGGNGSTSNINPPGSKGGDSYVAPSGTSVTATAGTDGGSGGDNSAGSFTSLPGLDLPCANAPAIASASAGTNPICPGTTTTLTANGVNGVNPVVTWWSLPGGNGTNYGNGTTLSNVGVGTYYARVTGDCGTPAEASITINPKPSPTCAAVTNRIYVDANNCTPGNGSSWDCAINQLSAAITQANSNPAITSIWVADGVYKPTTGTSRTVAMTISRGNLTILGGFAGGELNAADANPAVNESIISGDIGSQNDNSDNSYRLLNITGLPNGAAPLVIDGMVFEKANANGTGTSNYGGAIYFYKSSLNTTSVQIKRSTFRNNNASDNAGAIALYGNMDLDGCKFIGNSAVNSAGAIFSFQVSPTFNNCVFKGNTAPSGGAYYGNFGYPKFTRTVFAGNNGSYGGAVYQNATSIDYINCVFNANAATNGGALYQHNNSFSHILNSTLYNNTVSSYGSVAVFTYGSATTAENNIFWNNSAADVASISGGSNVWVNNIFNSNTAVPADNGTTRKLNKRGTDPLFVNPTDPDGADNLWGTNDDGLKLQPCSGTCSPAKDAGDNAPVTTAALTTDLLNNARVVCSTVDMGAYEDQNCGAPTAPSLLVDLNTIAEQNSTAIVANPFSTDLQIRYNSNEPCSVSVYAASGKRMYSANHIGQGITHVNATNWSRGMYQVILITASGKTKTFKVIRM